MLKRNVETIIDDLLQVELEKESNVNYDLMQGRIGIALFLLIYNNYFPNENAYKKGIDLLDISIQKIVLSGNPTLCNGMSGLAWTINYLIEKKVLHKDTREFFVPINNYLFNLFNSFCKKGDYDLLLGASGILQYFLLNNNSLKIKAINLFIDELKKRIEFENGKYKLSNYNDPQTYNLSFSHGNAGLLIALCKVCDSGYFNSEIEVIMRGIVMFLLSEKRSNVSSSSLFPNMEGQKIHSRLGWCYGDLTIGYTIFKTGKLLEDQFIINSGLEILLHSANRKSLKENFIKDAGICHGTVGIAIVFEIMYKYTQKEELKLAANYWYEQTLKFRKFNDDPVGYKSWTVIENEDVFLKNYSLLNGRTGIGLYFLAILTGDFSFFDSILIY